MSDEKLRRAKKSGEGEELDRPVDTEHEPAPASELPRGAALSVLWWETDEPEAT